jgi:hypothetical protein
MLSQDLFIHHVYFWLANPKAKKIMLHCSKVCRHLSKVPSIKHYHIGVPASTNRDVIDTSLPAIMAAYFDSKEDQDAYQVDPVHLHFVDTCKHLWKTVKGV